MSCPGWLAGFHDLTVLLRDDRTSCFDERQVQHKMFNRERMGGWIHCIALHCIACHVMSCHFEELSAAAAAAAAPTVVSWTRRCWLVVPKKYTACMAPPPPPPHHDHRDSDDKIMIIAAHSSSFPCLPVMVYITMELGESRHPDIQTSRHPSHPSVHPCPFTPRAI